MHSNPRHLDLLVLAPPPEVPRHDPVSTAERNERRYHGIGDPVNVHRHPQFSEIRASVSTPDFCPNPSPKTFNIQRSSTFAKPWPDKTPKGRSRLGS